MQTRDDEIRARINGETKTEMQDAAKKPAVVEK